MPPHVCFCRQPLQVSTWERQERRKAAGALLPQKQKARSRIPSWMHLPSAAVGGGGGGMMTSSASQESLAG
jgi:hypothetical protein